MIKKIIGVIIIIFISCSAMNEVIYEFHLSQVNNLRAWLTIPIYGFKAFWD